MATSLGLLTSVLLLGVAANRGGYFSCTDEPGHGSKHDGDSTIVVKDADTGTVLSAYRPGGRHIVEINSANGFKGFIVKPFIGSYTTFRKAAAGTLAGSTADHSQIMRMCPGGATQRFTEGPMNTARAKWSTPTVGTGTVVLHGFVVVDVTSWHVVEVSLPEGTPAAPSASPMPGGTGGGGAPSPDTPADACDPTVTCSGHGACTVDDSCSCDLGYASPACSACARGLKKQYWAAASRRRALYDDGEDDTEHTSTESTMDSGADDDGDSYDNSTVGDGGGGWVYGTAIAGGSTYTTWTCEPSDSGNTRASVTMRLLTPFDPSLHYVDGGNSRALSAHGSGRSMQQAAYATLRAAYISNLTSDIATSLGILTPRVQISGLSAGPDPSMGTVLVTVALLPPPWGSSPNERTVVQLAAMLATLAANPNSTIFKGMVTRNVDPWWPVSAAFSSATRPGAYDHTAALGPELTLSWSVVNGWLWMKLQKDSPGWAGIAFSPANSMVGSDAIVIQPSEGSSGLVSQYTLGSRDMGGIRRVADHQTILDTASGVFRIDTRTVYADDGGTASIRPSGWTAEVGRPLAAGEYPGARTITTGLGSPATSILAAWGSDGIMGPHTARNPAPGQPGYSSSSLSSGSDGISGSRHSNGQSFSGRIDVGQGTVLAGPDRTLLIVLHGCLMAIAWPLLSPAAALIARFGRSLFVEWSCCGRATSLDWYTAHRGLNMAAWLLSTIAFGLVMASMPVDLHFTDRHHIVGIFVWAVGLVQPLIGYLRPAKLIMGPHGMVIPNHNRAVWEAAHRYGGYSAMVVGVAGVITGVLLAGYSSSLVTATACVTGLWVLAFAVLQGQRASAAARSKDDAGRTEDMPADKPSPAPPSPAPGQAAEAGPVGVGEAALVQVAATASPTPSAPPAEAGKAVGVAIREPPRDSYPMMAVPQAPPAQAVRTSGLGARHESPDPEDLPGQPSSGGLRHDSEDVDADPTSDRPPQS